MEFITLNNGNKCPIMGLGTFMLSSDEAYNSTLNALKTGYTLVDTANAYVNERAVGKGIKDNLNIFDFNLTDVEMAEIAKLDKGERYYTRTDEALAGFAAWQPIYESR